MSDLDQLAEDLGVSIASTPDGTDKGWPKGYLRHVYGPLMKTQRDSPVRLLEIGVRSGASMRLWHEYFPHGSIVGLDDVSDVVKPRREWTELDRAEYVVGDAYSDGALHRVAGEFDFVIDDGPHSRATQEWTIEHWSPRLKRGGYLVVEDIQGGRATAIRLLAAIPAALRGCARIVDLRARTGQSDALVVVVHRCDTSCNMPLPVPNELAGARRAANSFAAPVLTAGNAASSVARRLKRTLMPGIKSS